VTKSYFAEQKGKQTMSATFSVNRHTLSEEHAFHSGRLPDELLLSNAEFEWLWNQHPAEYHRIKIHGHECETPRWQQAFGEDYHYTGRTNRALPIPILLERFMTWCRIEIHDELNGVLVNWYDGRLGHYIGKHRDSRKNMVAGAPIVTISFGEARTFRLRAWKGEGYLDFAAENGTVFVMPYETNLAFTHEVPHFESCHGQRISVTLRAFHKTL